MKRKNFKTLGLNKKSVSNLESYHVKGGSTIVLSAVGICNYPAPSKGDTASWCKCN